MERAGAADRVPSAPESGVSNKLTKKNITPTSTLQKLLFQSTNTHTPTHIHTVYTHTHTHTNAILNNTGFHSPKSNSLKVSMKK